MYKILKNGNSINGDKFMNKKFNTGTYNNGVDDYRQKNSLLNKIMDENEKLLSKIDNKRNRHPK